MKQRTFNIICILISVVCLTTQAQDNFVLTSISKTNLNHIKIKWYSKTFIYPEGVAIYKKENTESNWKKINTTPLKKGNYKPSTEEFNQDKELKSYMELVNSITKLEGVPLLGAYIKSFKSEAFSKFLGIEFIDTVASMGKELQYRICVLHKGTENELGISNSIISGIATEILPPQKTDIILKNKKAIIKWFPETCRYYGVTIYRSGDSLTNYKTQLNKEPIIVSKTKDKNGELVYPDQFFVDETIEEDSTYYYYFKAIDFFGKESAFSNPIKLVVKDITPPDPPVFINKTVKQKQITLTWKKQIIEKDFSGYTIYRAYKDEKKYAQVNKKLLVQTDSIFTDTVTNYGLYQYVIKSIDKSGNESLAAEIPIEILDEEPPLIPKNLSIKSDTGKVLLTWDKNTEPDLWGYMIYQTINKNTNNDSYVLITPTPIKTNVFKQALAKNSKNTFLYKVLAIDSSYNKSQLSEFASVTLPDVVAPSEPFIHHCYLNDKKNVVIEFFKNTELDLMGYDLYKTYTDNNVEKIQKVNTQLIDKNAINYSDKSDKNEGLVTYYMVAIDSANNHSKKSPLVKLNIKKEEKVVNHEFKRFNAKPLKTDNSWSLTWKITNNDTAVFYVVYTKEKNGDNFEPHTKNLDETTYIVNLKPKTLVQVRAYTKKGLVAKSKILILENK